MLFIVSVKPQIVEFVSINHSFLEFLYRYYASSWPSSLQSELFSVMYCFEILSFVNFFNGLYLHSFMALICFLWNIKVSYIIALGPFDIDVILCKETW